MRQSKPEWWCKVSSEHEILRLCIYPSRKPLFRKAIVEEASQLVKLSLRYWEITMENALRLHQGVCVEAERFWSLHVPGIDTSVEKTSFAQEGFATKSFDSKFWTAEHCICVCFGPVRKFAASKSFSWENFVRSGKFRYENFWFTNFERQKHSICLCVGPVLEF